MKETKNRIDDDYFADLVLTDPDFRKAYFENNFEAFFDYHFGWLEKAPFEPEWNEDLENEEINLVFEAFR